MLKILPSSLLLPFFLQVQKCKGGDPQKLIIRTEDFPIFMPLGLKSLECLIENDVSPRTLEFLLKYKDNIQLLNVAVAPAFRDDDEKGEDQEELKRALKSFLASLDELRSIYVKRQVWALDTLVDTSDGLVCPKLFKFTLSTSVTYSEKDTSVFLQELLQSRPNIKSLTYCGYEMTFDVSFLGPLVNIKEVNGAKVSSFQELVDCVNTFPNLRKFSVHLTDWTGSMELLGSLSSLCHLTVMHGDYQVDFYPVMAPYLVNNGHKLTELNIHYFRSVSVQFLGKYCPNLKCLTLSCDVIEFDVKSENWTAGLDQKRSCAWKECEFPKLRELSLTCSIKQSYPVKFLIKESKALEQLHVSLSDYERGHERYVDVSYHALDFILENIPDSLQRLELWEPKPLMLQFFKMISLQNKVPILKVRGCPVSA